VSGNGDGGEKEKKVSEQWRRGSYGVSTFGCMVSDRSLYSLMRHLLIVCLPVPYRTDLFAQRPRRPMCNVLMPKTRLT
jgi:hypothetical protein